MSIYSPRDAQRLLDVPDSTLRRWSRRFSHRLSEGAQRRKRTYNDSDLETFARIKALTAQNYTLDTVDGMLGEIIHQPGGDQRSLALPGVLREINGIHGTLSDHDQQLAAMRARMDQIEREYNTPWWKKIFRR